MPFLNRHHGGNEPFDLAARIDAELRARIEDAVDFACLNAMVSAREGAGASPPAAENPRDRDEYVARVAAFLDLLRDELTTQLSDEQRRRLGGVLSAEARGVEAALRAQVALAKELPDYWQRFEVIRQRGLTGVAPWRGESAVASSRGERRRLLDWLLGRG